MSVHLLRVIKSFQGLSTDAKPRDEVPEGSTFYESDTKKYFVFTDEGWLERDPTSSKVHSSTDFEDQVLEQLQQLNQYMALIVGIDFSNQPGPSADFSEYPG